MKTGVVSVLCVLLVASLPSAVKGQVFSNNSRIAEQTYDLDNAQFRTDNSALDRLEIYYKIYNSNLQFVKAGENYKASYEIDVSIEDDHGKPIKSYSREKDFTVDSYDKTLSEKDYRTSQVNLLVQPGKYKVAFNLVDKNSGTTTKKEFKVTLNKFESRNPSASGIEFVQAVDTSAYDSLFLKGNKTVIPSVNRNYGGASSTASPVLLYYQELYQGSDKREQVKIETQILDRHYDAVYRDTLTSVFTSDPLQQVRQISLSGIKAGTYTLNIVLKGRREQVIEDIREPFSIYWSPDELMKNDFAAAVSQLKYIASGKEIDSLKKAKTDEERLKLWDNFWLRHDPTPGTGENELKRSYYQRIEFANQHFSVMKREGWLTDRGMVYITYGPPDQVEDFPFEVDSKAYQVWYYYRSDNVRKFVFVDEWGDGDYLLQFPYDGLYR